MTTNSIHETETLSLKHQYQIYRSDRSDALDKYSISIDAPIPELNSEFAKYYTAINEDTKSDQYFAVVLEHVYNTPIEVMERLKYNSANNNFVSLITYGLVRMSYDNKYHIVGIVAKYNAQRTLESVINTEGKLSVDVVIKNLIPSITQALQFCRRYGISCGNISPHNILASKDMQFCLREFFVPSPHFGQGSVYLAPEIADCVSVGRVTTSTVPDVYALGITVYYAIIGSTKVLEDVEYQSSYTALRLEHGTYHALSSKHKLPAILNDFFKGALNDHSADRWDVKDLTHWCLGKLHKDDKVSTVKAVKQAIGFNKSSYSNQRALASALYNSWSEAINFISDELFQKWVQRHAGKNPMADALTPLMSQPLNKRATHNAQTVNEYLFKIITIIDRSTLIRYDASCITLESIPNVLFDGFVGQKRNIIDSTLIILTNSWWRQFIVDQIHDSALDGYISTLLAASSVYMTGPNTAVCGLERMTYTLNPYVPCQSQSLVDEYVITTADFLTAMDKIASHNPEHIIIDRHLVAFLASRVGVKHEYEAYLTSDFIKISQPLVAQFAVLLSMAHSANPSVNIHAIIYVLGHRLIELLEKNIHSTKLLKVMTDRILDAAQEGDLTQILSILSNAKIFHNDKVGYKKACADVAQLNIRIAELQNVDDIRILGATLGQRASVLFAYTLCILVALTLVV